MGTPVGRKAGLAPAEASLAWAPEDPQGLQAPAPNWLPKILSLPHSLAVFYPLPTSAALQ